eukprot:4915868-Alexandrium_andersonii.AAC.1
MGGDCRGAKGGGGGQGRGQRCNDGEGGQLFSTLSILPPLLYVLYPSRAASTSSTSSQLAGNVAKAQLRSKNAASAQPCLLYTSPSPRD